MKAVEFKSRLKDKTIEIPENITLNLSENEEVRVIILINDEDYKEESDFKYIARDQFFKGYSDKDSVYDEE